MTRISIIGSGVVGSATGKGFHKMGHKVIFYDVSKDQLLPLLEHGYCISENIKDVISKSDVSFVCVNTPNNYGGRKQDLSQLMSALYDIANVLDSIRKYHLVVFRSTILPGTMRNVILDYLEKNCSSQRGKDYDICYNPEFLRQRTALDDFMNPARVVIGLERKNIKISSRSSSFPYLLLKKLYGQLTKNIIVTDYESAELIKYASNCFLALKISFFNEIGMICKQLGIDDKVVSHVVSLDKRIGAYGTVAGNPFDGSCLPKDIDVFISFIKKLQIDPDLIGVALRINDLFKTNLSSIDSVIA